MIQNNPLGGKPGSKMLFKENNPNAEDSLARWHEVFVEICDPTEYAAALELAGSWAEWNRMKLCWPGFKKYIEVWTDEVEIKIRSQAVMETIKQAKNKDSSAAKWLAEGKYKPKIAGRPTKAAIERETKIQATAYSENEDEILRVLDHIAIH